MSGSWPFLTRYDGSHLDKVAMPLGGIGTGCVSLGGRGDLRDWEIMNRPAKGFTPDRTLFAVRVRDGSRPPVARLLEGPIDPVRHEGPHGCPLPNHGLPRFERCEFRGAYPLATIDLADRDVPVTATLRAFNPMVPADTGASSLPVAVLQYVLRNTLDRPVSVSVCGSVANVIGTDGTNGAPSRNVNTVRTEGALTGIVFGSDGVPRDSEFWGTMALTTSGPGRISHRTAWTDESWGGSLLDFWDDFLTDGQLEDRPTTTDDPAGSLCVEREIPAGGEIDVTFLLTWHFPHRRAWEYRGHYSDPQWGYGTDIVGNHYTTVFADAWSVASAVADRLNDLRERTVGFVTAFCAADVPVEIKDAALSNLSTLRTQTCFRISDGHFFGWEGLNDTYGSCLGSCTHVWNYEQATAHLYGDLARSMREVEFGHSTDAEGLMSFRAFLPLPRATEWGLAAADGQLGCIVKLYRDWLLSGDDAWLAALWPAARRALEFCWRPGGWDADRDGVMEGPQHNTADVEYYGPNPQIGAWYLAALAAAARLADHAGEADFAATCRRLYEQGREWTDTNLFNGKYYVQQVRAPGAGQEVPAGLRHEAMGAQELADPDFQIGTGCFADQLIGQVAAHVCGLGHVLDPDNVRSALRSVVELNFRERLHGTVNPMRSYALGDEAGLLMCTYPFGDRPRRPTPYFAEVWTGVEYGVAAALLYEGDVEPARRLVAGVRDRFDGRRRNPYNEAECGHHYARAMASWATLLAYTGFGYDGRTGAIRFTRSTGPGRFFWSTGYAWGTVEQRPGDDGTEVILTVQGGRLWLTGIALTGLGAGPVGPTLLRTGDSATVTL